MNRLSVGAAGLVLARREQGLDPRLDEVDWSLLDLDRLDRLAVETGLSYRRLLPPVGQSQHDQQRLRDEAVARVR